MMPITRVQRSSAVASEPLGSKAKFWYRDNDRRLLFKADDRGTGEDWAEVVASRLCERLGLPHVTYELAEEWSQQDRVGPGVICDNMAPPPISLVLGNELLLEHDPEYPSQDRRRVKQHTVGAVANAVARLDTPGEGWTTDTPTDVKKAVDVFAG